MLDSIDNEARERRRQRLITEAARRQGIVPMSFDELFASYPRGTDEEEAAFDEAMRELYEEKERERQCHQCSAIRRS